MNLREYLDWKQIRYCDFAETIGVSLPQIERYIAPSGPASIPRPRVMHRIIEETKGHVTPNDFYGICIGMKELDQGLLDELEKQNA